MRLRLYTRWGVGFVAFFLIGIGCMDSQAVNPPKEEETKVTRQPIDQSQKRNHQSIRAEKLVYYNDKETSELENIKKESIIYKGSQHSKKVALTFDDGPDIVLTKKILSILKRENVPATFFVTGNMVKAHPEMLKEIVRQGHVIGNHTWNHPQLTQLPNEKIDEQLRRTNQVIEKHIGKKVRLFRPPYGAVNDRVVKQIKEQDFLIVNWSVDTNDWQGHSSAKIQQIVKHQMTNGGIVLQHNAGDKLHGTVEALPAIIAYLKKQNYQLVTVDQLLDTPAYQSINQ